MSIFKNQRGFSIIEVLVAAGMLGVVSLGVSHVMTNMGKTMKWTETKNEEMALINRFNYELRDQQVCTHTFVGFCTEVATNRVGRYTTKKACEDASGSTVPAPFVWTDRPQALGNIPIVYGRSNTAIFTQGNPYGSGSGRITLTSITFMTDPSPGNTPAVGVQTNAIVEMLITRNDGTASIAAKETKHQVNLTVKWASATTISECYADREDTIMTAKMEACQNIGGDFDATEDWCKLKPGPESNPTHAKRLGPTPGTTLISRAVEQSYVDDLFRRMCQGPGRVYNPGDGDITQMGAPTCDIDVSRLAGTTCATNQYVYSVGFINDSINDFVAPGTKYDPDNSGDGDTLQVQCRNKCDGDGVISLGVDGSGNEICLGDGQAAPYNCANGDIPMLIGGHWRCKNPTTTGCVNTADANYVYIKVFDGWDATTGDAKCREVARYPKNACPAGQVMTGWTYALSTPVGQAANSGSNMTPQCCVKGTGCPASSGLCKNGYKAPLDACGFTCPGDIDWSESVTQPLTYGCEYTTDVKRYTRNFPEYVCGPPANPSPTIVTSRDCFLGGDDKYHSYQQCRDAGGTVQFYSKVGDAPGPTTKLFSGKEEDSYCFFTQPATAGTYGREGTAMLGSCTNCNFVSIDVNAVRSARSCSTVSLTFGKTWLTAASSANNIVYEVSATGCNSYSLANVGTTCGSWGESRSYTIPYGVYLEASTWDRAYWPNSYVSDGGYTPVSGTTQSDHGTLPNPGTWPTAHYDAWDQDHAGCPDNANGQTHWESYLCYAKITGKSCK